MLLELTVAWLPMLLELVRNRSSRGRACRVAAPSNLPPSTAKGEACAEACAAAGLLFIPSFSKLPAVSVWTPYAGVASYEGASAPLAPLSELRWAGLLRGLCAGLYGVASISRPAPSARAYASSLGVMATPSSVLSL
tara:strand:- start:463 stop:873 length:411 start_codon:yes stop_codon:yes gene_type:complete